MKLTTLILIFLSSISAFAQETESSVVVKKERAPAKPKLASALSAILPGAGQAYNRSFWKMPLIYAGIGTGIYFYNESRKEYKIYSDSYVARYGDMSVADPLAGENLSESFLLNELEVYRKQQEWAIIGMTAVYVIQIVEAAVDAHLSSFDVSEDLSLRIGPSPVFAQNNIHPGIGLRLQLK